AEQGASFCDLTGAYALREIRPGQRCVLRCHALLLSVVHLRGSIYRSTLRAVRSPGRDPPARFARSAPPPVEHGLRGHHMRLERGRNLLDQLSELGVLDLRHERGGDRVEHRLVEGYLVLQERPVELRPGEFTEPSHGCLMVTRALVVRGRGGRDAKPRGKIPSLLPNLPVVAGEHAAELFHFAGMSALAGEHAGFDVPRVRGVEDR